MRRKRKLTIFFYVVSDYIASLLAWTGLFWFRKMYIQKINYDNFFDYFADPNYLYGLLFVPVIWLLIYFFAGTYTDVYKKSRLNETIKTFWTTIIGVVIIFFAVLLDDIISNDYTNYYRIAGFLFTLQFLFTFAGRQLIINWAQNQIRKGKAGYKTLIIGGNDKAVELYKEIISQDGKLGYDFVGFIDANGESDVPLRNYMKNLGKLKDINRLIQANDIEEVVIAIESTEHHLLKKIIDDLASWDVRIKIIPDMYDILSGSVKMNHLFGAALIEIDPELMPQWQKAVKRAVDIAASAVFLTLLFPLCVYIAIRVKFSSPGPVFYVQTRIGQYGKPFKIYKFRSMYVDAEADGPRLSSDNDSRITPFGRVLRKWRLDEIPQFYNVLKGDMSLVGPRPEREYFIKKIIERAPAYRHLQKVKPGITSLGMVKYGYAENIDQMIQRMKYDILYIENISLALDFKILFYTFLTVIQGKGK